jgi:predicted small secreted protein
MLRKLMTVAVMAGSLAISGCNTVRGVGQDVQSVANCTEAMMKRGEC